MTESMDFRLLQALQVLVAESHVTRAADRLGMSQPKLSHILRRLRKTTNDPLLVRTANGMEPTDLARDLASASSEFLARWDSMIARGADFEVGTASVLVKMLAADFWIHHVLVPVTRELRLTAPNVALSIGTPSRLGMHEGLVSGELDLVIGYATQSTQDLFISQLLSYEMVCIMAADHPRIGDMLDFDQYIREDHVVLTFGSRREPSLMERFVDGLMEERGLTRSVKVHIPTVLTAPELVAATDLLALVPKQLAEENAARLGLKYFPVPFELPLQNISLIWHERTHRNPAHQWIRSLIRQIVRRQSP